MPAADINNKQTHPHIHANPHKTVSWAMKLHALSITRWKHADASIKEPVHLSFAVDLSQLSFFQRGTVKEVPFHKTTHAHSRMQCGLVCCRHGDATGVLQGLLKLRRRSGEKTPTCGGLLRVH